MPTPGHFILHSRCVPPLGAGDYVLEGIQHVAGGLTEPYHGHIRITSPRFRMPPDHILSTFPPANSEGAYETRLPQIVLRRRTLPWERVMDPAHREIPWLALVVIAEGEGQLSGETPVAECVTSGVTLSGPNDVATSIYLAVSQTVVTKIFPTAEDLPLLVHMREVDINDTELAMGDDDGFLAVVLANRLPQFDRHACKPVRYLACLINLEGQLDVLPQPSDAIDGFVATDPVQDLRVLVEGKPFTADHVAMGKGLRATAEDSRSEVKATSTRGRSSPSGRGGASAGWATTPARIEAVAASAAPEEAARLVRDAMGMGFRLPVEYLVAEKVYRFPVLAHWSFTCTGAGSFETLLRGLDVGLLGTLAAGPAARPRPDCATPPQGDAPPAAPVPRPDPELAETGHVGLPHLTRRGDQVRAWYRGPLSLHVTQRDQHGEGHLPLAHTSDQLRRVVPDGREDLTLAAAFEIGRLLALSQPSVVSALMRWRREQFGAERARRLAGLALEDLTALAPALDGPLSDLGQLVGRHFVLEAARSPERVLAPSRPLVDSGRPLDFLVGDLDEIIAEGFGIPLTQVRELAESVGAVDALHSVPVPRSPAARFDAQAASQLRRTLGATVYEMAEKMAHGGPGGPLGESGGVNEESDALGDLLAGAARRREGES